MHFRPMFKSALRPFRAQQRRSITRVLLRGALTALVLVGAASCVLITDIDRTKIPPEEVTIPEQPDAGSTPEPEMPPADDDDMPVDGGAMDAGPRGDGGDGDGGDGDGGELSGDGGEPMPMDDAGDPATPEDAGETKMGTDAAPDAAAEPDPPAEPEMTPDSGASTDAGN